MSNHRKAVICIPSYRTGDSSVFSEVVPYLMQRGWHRPWGKGHGSHVGRNRNLLSNWFLSDAQCQRFEWSFWADDDMLFRPQAAVNLLSEAMAEGRQVLNMLAVPGRHNVGTFSADLAEADVTPDGRRCIRFGSAGRHYRCHNVGMGVTVIHRSVFERLRDVADFGIIADPKAEVPVTGWEFFPSGFGIGKRVQGPDDEHPRSLGEDYGFSALCRLADIPIHTTTRQRIFHLHEYPYSWEDAFSKIRRAADDALTVLL